MEDSEIKNGIVKEGMDVYHTGHVEKPKFPEIKGPIRTSAHPQRAEFKENWQIAPIPQIAYIHTPIPEITHYRFSYSRVIRFIETDE